MSGMALFCVFGRSRWSDSRHAENLLPDFDNQGKLQFLEVQSTVHKTARALHLRHMFLPVVAPATGGFRRLLGSAMDASQRHVAYQ